jgi:urease accessory protein
MAMQTRIMNMAHKMKHRRVVGFQSRAAHSDHLSPPFGPDPREADSDHLSPVGRGRPEGPGEGGLSFLATPVSPHPTPLPASKSDVSDFDQSLNARTREHPGSGGERENATAGSQCVDGDSSQSAAAPPEAGGAAISEAVLYRLMAWLSPAYPVGAFSYSSGLEWAVEAGDVKNADTLAAWLAVVVGDGGGFCDAVLFAHAHRATTARDEEALRSVAELAAAFAPSKERHLETSAQGGAFLEVTRAAWPCAALDFLAQTWPGPYAYPIAVATAAAGHGIAVEPALAAYLHAVAANLVSAGVRLIPLGQTDGQRVIAALEPLIGATARRALVTRLEEMGAAAFRADLASQRHETQYTRLFRS